MSVDVEIEYEAKIDLETEKPLCRCCLSTKNRMLDATKVSQYFMDLANINVFPSDGLPRWICFECNALLLKAVQFKYKMLQAHNILYEYITRCAPFPIDGSDPELSKHASQQLCATLTLNVDNGKGRLGFHKVLQHEKQVKKTELNSFELPPQSDSAHVELAEEATRVELINTLQVKEEGRSDYEDDMPLTEFRSNSNEIVDAIIENSEPIKIEPELKKRKKEKKKEAKTKRKKVSEETTEEPPKKSIRKPIEIDPEKIKIIVLNPNEQIKQREEESKASLKFPYQCNLCFKGFNFESKLQNHMAKHSPSRGRFPCHLCRMHLPTAHSLATHALIHTRRYECRACGRRMIDRASIVHHYRTEHEGITTVISCPLCGKMSSNSKTHRGHMRNHHSGERPKCDRCGKTFVNKDSLAEHMQIHEGVKNYECSVCGKRCRTRAQIKYHQLRHSDARNYYCVECDARFKTAHSLRQHLQKSLKHLDEQSLSHACHLCPRRYRTAALLATHVAVKHERSRPHACPCGATLATRASLGKHAASVHGGRRPPHSHVCDTCGKAFRGKSVLTNHIRTHTGEKPYSCPECGRAFSQRTAMLTHQRRGHCKSAKAPPPIFSPPKAEPPLVEPWPRSQEVFYVTAGP